ncbi:hypothetical protein PGUG_01118 [Meyerozyma guilliermondii ATCC 6260]|uniref:Uncharacterized protein n=1 Tax=Meyerozyma guilliermondii (strain ATCC 6260 / CBS 566 / DSM 6381 / JCM 1539 / NBRC 10279 / NRRL Y-324) TaxID=294746 RepID=A5DCW3_PICGU|nr:uncharacterized protein PGUG_01118 [Meyerozyma guilliermondii ATCC 6260]EDK37019.2 hypothetical protein PGUG_01118 [Meyerozyma guilliermondii ATCC 6260]
MFVSCLELSAFLASEKRNTLVHIYVKKLQQVFGIEFLVIKAGLKEFQKRIQQGSSIFFLESGIHNLTFEYHHGILTNFNGILSFDKYVSFLVSEKLEKFYSCPVVCALANKFHDFAIGLLKSGPTCGICSFCKFYSFVASCENYGVNHLSDKAALLLRRFSKLG